MSSQTTFVVDFYAAIEKLKVDAAKVGMSITSICRKENISRATPDRWARETPTTVMLLTRMQQVVRDEEVRIAAGGAPLDLGKELQQQ